MRIWAVLILLFLSGCANPYDSGRSPADIPKHVSVIAVRDVYLVEGRATDSLSPEMRRYAKYPPMKTSLTLQEDPPLVVVTRQAVMDTLRSQGYQVVQGRNAKADLLVTLFVTAQAGNWLLSGQVGVVGQVFNRDGMTIFNVGYKASVDTPPENEKNAMPVFVKAAAAIAAQKTATYIAGEVQGVGYVEPWHINIPR